MGKNYQKRGEIKEQVSLMFILYQFRTLCWWCTIHDLNCALPASYVFVYFKYLHFKLLVGFVIPKLVIWYLQVMGYSDTDVAEYLYKSKHDIDSLFNYLCKDLSKSCNKKPPPVPKVTIIWNWCSWYIFMIGASFDEINLPDWLWICDK
jgi:hypothetical protein